MIEMNTSLPMDRGNAASALPVENLRPNVGNPATPAARQAETPPGVEVQISTAAREAAARDPLPASTNATEPTRAANAPPDDGATPVTQGAGNQAALEAQNGASQNRAVQLFSETAGIGLEQANPSPLRDIA